MRYIIIMMHSLFLLCCLSLLMAVKGADVTVSYSVEYPPRDEYPCGVKQPPLPNPSVPVLIPAGASAYKVMENAVSDYGASYKFTATYYGSALGYLIDAINDVPVAVTQLPPSVCYWEFYVKYPNGTEVSSAVGVSSFTFNSSGYGMTMRYHNSAHSKAMQAVEDTLRSNF